MKRRLSDDRRLQDVVLDLLVTTTMMMSAIVNAIQRITRNE
jgi:hypothetical protein